MQEYSHGSVSAEFFQLQDKPCRLRCTPEIDFLRGEAGSVGMGDFLDDPEMQHVGVKVLKAFLDVGLFESMAWARWGAAKWVQNLPRAVAANAYGARAGRSKTSGKRFVLQSLRMLHKLM